MRRVFMGLVAVAALAGQASFAAPPQLHTVTLVLKGHRFTPSEVKVPAGQKVRIVVINQDTATDEFDSHDLKVEELVTPNGRATMVVGPLKPGTYSFMGEFHAETAQGRLLAVEEDADNARSRPDRLPRGS